MAVLAILILAGLGFAFWRAALAAYRRMVATAKTGGVTSSNCFFVGNDFSFMAISHICRQQMTRFLFYIKYQVPTFLMVSAVNVNDKW